MSNTERIWLGCAAGFVAVLSKLLAQDYVLVEKLGNGEVSHFLAGYLVVALILVLMGGFVAWISEEKVRVKVAALAISAPALITTWAGGTKSQAADHAARESAQIGVFRFLDIVPSAHAGAERSPAPDNPRESMGTIERLQTGVGFFFGYGRDPLKYRVIAGEYPAREEAMRVAEKINSRDPRFNARVVDPTPGSEYFPVVVGETGYLSRAKEVKGELLATGVAPHARLVPAPQQ